MFLKGCPVARRSRIAKIIKWATEKQLVRRLGTHVFVAGFGVSMLLFSHCNPPRTCEYDESTTEYWVNTRTEGTMKREDMEQLSRKRTHEQAVSADSLSATALGGPTADFAPDDFGAIAGREGEAHMPAPFLKRA